MTNDKEIRRTKSERAGLLHFSGFEIPSSFVIRHSDFDGHALLRGALNKMQLLGARLITVWMRFFSVALVCATVKAGEMPPHALADLKVFPSSVELNTRRDHQSFVVQAIYSDGITRDATRQCLCALAQPSIAKLDKSTLFPVADGTTELKITFQEKTLLVPVKVTRAAEERPISFKLDVMPVFMKGGCNAGSCHGSARGKDGFRLSLFGFDADGDHKRLTTEMIGRRVNLAIPRESLMLEKATGKVQHTGGERFKEDSEMYQTLLRWLKASVPADATNVARCTDLQIEPRQLVLESGSTHKVNVKATYSDGTHADVT